MTKILKSKGILAGVLLVLAGWSVGCKGPMEMTLRGGPDMNSGGNAAVVRIYELSNNTKFTRSTVESFWRSDEEALGNELLRPTQEYVIYPDQAREIDLKIEKDVKYIGVAADLRNPVADNWRAIFPAKEVKGKRVSVRVGETGLIVDTE